MRVLVCALLLAMAAPPVRGQDTPAARAARDGADTLPVRRVILYKTGVGYFEHRGRITDSQLERLIGEVTFEMVATKG